MKRVVLIIIAGLLLFGIGAVVQDSRAATPSGPPSLIANPGDGWPACNWWTRWVILARWEPALQTAVAYECRPDYGYIWLAIG